jgi:tetratricopeptide (TPR) repeat protein
MLQRAFLLVMLLATYPFQRLAQGQAAPEEQLTVRVTYEDDRPATANLRVELLSAYGSSVAIRTTDGYGSVVFTHLQPAKYRLRVSGEGVVTTEGGELDMGSSGPNVTQYVRVRKVASPNELGLSSAIDLAVPGEAKKEFEKAADKMEQKNWPEAKAHLDRAIAIYPKYALAYNNLGVSYLKLGQGDKAIEAFRTATQLDEHLNQANLYLGRFYYDNKDYKVAEPYLVRAAQTEPRNPQVLTALANAQLRNGEPDEALANAQKVHLLPDHNKFAIVHLIAAEIFSSRGENQKVGEQYRQFLQEDPHSPMAPKVKDALAKLEAK